MFIQKIYTYIRNKKASSENNSAASLYNMDNCFIENPIQKSKMAADLKNKKSTKPHTQSNYILKKPNQCAQSLTQGVIDFNSGESEHPRHYLRFLLSEIDGAEKKSIQIEENLRKYIKSKRKDIKNQQVEAYRKSPNKFEKLLNILIEKIEKQNSIQNHLTYLATVNRFNEDYKQFIDNK